jgi:hypothetical protein
MIKLIIILTRCNTNEPILDFGGHLGFWAALVFERKLLLMKPNPQKKFQVNLPICFCISPEYKIQDVHLVAILDFVWHCF